MVFGLLAYWSSAIAWSLSLYIRRADPRPCQSTRLPSVPVQALGVSALWLYVPGTTVFKESLRGPKRKRKRWAFRTAFAMPHTSYVLDLKSQRIAFLTVRRSLKHGHLRKRGGRGGGGGGEGPPQFANATPRGLAVHHMLNTRPRLMIRFSKYVTHTLSFGDSGSSYI